MIRSTQERRRNRRDYDVKRKDVEEGIERVGNDGRGHVSGRSG